jgi:hypothetical protein
MDQGVVARGDGRPTFGLGLGRLLEARPEPLANGRREAVKGSTGMAVSGGVTGP